MMTASAGMILSDLQPKRLRKFKERNVELDIDQQISSVGLNSRFQEHEFLKQDWLDGKHSGVI